ncbi:MAG: IclR family transcriptional regulator [Candidatus Dormiibacterota bacterium]
MLPPIDAAAPAVRALPRPPGTQTVERALAALDVLSQSPNLSLTQIAHELELNVSTARRLVTTLEARGYVRRATPGYALGFKLVELAGLTLNHTELVRHSLTELDQLRDHLDLNANLAILSGGDVLHLAYAVRSDTPRYYTSIGRRAVAHCTALGKVLLSAEVREQVHAEIRRRGWRPYTPRSIQDFDALDRALDEVIAEGHAIDRDERTLGTACLAAPVRDRSGRIAAAISVSGAGQRFDALGVERIRREVVEHARNVSLKLGCFDR